MVLNKVALSICYRLKRSLKVCWSVAKSVKCTKKGKTRPGSDRQRLFFFFLSFFFLRDGGSATNTHRNTRVHTVDCDLSEVTAEEIACLHFSSSISCSLYKRTSMVFPISKALCFSPSYLNFKSLLVESVEKR